MVVIHCRLTMQLDALYCICEFTTATLLPRRINHTLALVATMQYHNNLSPIDPNISVIQKISLRLSDTVHWLNFTTKNSRRLNPRQNSRNFNTERQTDPRTRLENFNGRRSMSIIKSPFFLQKSLSNGELQSWTIISERSALHYHATSFPNWSAVQPPPPTTKQNLTLGRFGTGLEVPFLDAAKRVSCLWYIYFRINLWMLLHGYC